MIQSYVCNVNTNVLYINGKVIICIFVEKGYAYGIDNLRIIVNDIVNKFRFILDLVFSPKRLVVLCYVSGDKIVICCFYAKLVALRG